MLWKQLFRRRDSADSSMWEWSIDLISHSKIKMRDAARFRRVPLPCRFSNFTAKLRDAALSPNTLHAVRHARDLQVFTNLAALSAHRPEQHIAIANTGFASRPEKSTTKSNWACCFGITRLMGYYFPSSNIPCYLNSCITKFEWRRLVRS